MTPMYRRGPAAVMEDSAAAEADFVRGTAISRSVPVTVVVKPVAPDAGLGLASAAGLVPGGSAAGLVPAGSAGSAGSAAGLVPAGAAAGLGPAGGGQGRA